MKIILWTWIAYRAWESLRWRFFCVFSLWRHWFVFSLRNERRNGTASWIEHHSLKIYKKNTKRLWLQERDPLPTRKVFDRIKPCKFILPVPLVSPHAKNSLKSFEFNRKSISSNIILTSWAVRKPSWFESNLRNASLTSSRRDSLSSAILERLSSSRCSFGL